MKHMKVLHSKLVLIKMNFEYDTLRALNSAQLSTKDYSVELILKVLYSSKCIKVPMQIADFV